MNKLLVICGPTASGKTKLALRMAKKFDAELISADSRQVYRGLDIGTGKDLTKKLETGDVKINHYTIEGIRIWGYDLIGPRDEFSAGRYVVMVRQMINDIWKRGKLPILVGGTGLYIRGAVDGIDTVNIGQNKKLRESLEKRSVDDLFELLARLAPIKSASLNKSDRVNPRRLIRAIEIAHWKMENKKQKKRRPIKENVKFIGLTAPTNILTKRIGNRIRKMTRLGIAKEIEKLLAQGVTWNHQSMSSVGYKEWEGYFAGKTSKKEVLKKWNRNSVKYAKRQITWFKTDKRIIWFDTSKKGYVKGVEKVVTKWYKAS